MSSEPLLLAQLSDPHIVVGPGDGASSDALARAVAAVAAFDPAPAAVLVTGDLADHGAAPEYERVRELLAPLTMPVHVLAGNHDDRDALRDAFGLQTAGDTVQYATRSGPMRLLIADTTEPGRDDGRLPAERLEWLEAELAAEPETKTIVAMHHQPILTGVPAIDLLGMPAADRAALAALLTRHSQVRRVVVGHAHRTIVGVLGGCGVFVCPSCHIQLKLDLHSEEIQLADEPPGFALHVAAGDEVASHVQPIG